MPPGAAVPSAQPSISAALHMGFAAFAVPTCLMPSRWDPGLLVYHGPLLIAVEMYCEGT